MSDGLFDMLFTHPSHHIGELAVAQGLDLVKGPPKDRRAFGFIDLVDEAYNKKVHTKYLDMSFCKFQLRPAFGETVDCILENLGAWKKLPKDLQDLIFLPPSPI